MAKLQMQKELQEEALLDGAIKEKSSRQYEKKRRQNGYEDTRPEVYTASTDSGDTYVANSATTVPSEYESEDLPPTFEGYQPPGRLVLFELIAFVLLVYLLMANPGSGSLTAISSDTKGGVGLLSRSSQCPPTGNSMLKQELTIFRKLHWRDLHFMAGCCQRIRREEYGIKRGGWLIYWRDVRG